MNDDRLLLEMRRWLQEERVAVPDAEEAGQRIASQLPTTRQRRHRRWRLPFLARTAGPPAASDTTEYQPSPVPATNARTPTVIGRTRSMLSPAKAITAGALVFGIGGVMLIAQPFQQQASLPGAAIPSEPEVTPVSLTFVPSGQIRASEVETVNGVVMQTGACWTPVLTDASDPRIDGRLVYCADGASFGGDTLRHLTYRIENDDGAWQGSTVSFLPGGVFADAETVLLTGEGAYDGWYAWLDVSDWSGVTGAVFNFPPPEAPVPPAVD